ncbi:tyrosine-type recombinase/integrase [Planctomycetota bacterium]
MTKPNSQRKTRSDKFPLTIHPTGQYCKKIKGKLYYFGADKEQALTRYLEDAAYLHLGKGTKQKSMGDSLSLKMLCNLYLDHQKSRTTIGEVKPRHVSDQTFILRGFVKFVGPNRLVSAVTTIDLQNYRTKLIKATRTPNTINNHISTIKALYNWALENEIMDNVPNLKAVKKIANPRNDKPTFTLQQTQKLLQNASTQMKAMIWLGLNCGFGCTDCSQLKWKNLDLQNSRVDFPRGKTGIDRNLPLWPETVQALAKTPKQGDLVFYTQRGNPWVRTIRSVKEDGTDKYVKDDAISKEFSKTIQKAGIQTEKGVGFYTLRRTAATWTARSGDPFAVQKLLGHADLKMATTYVQDVSEQTDRAINNTRKFLIQKDS